jgi:8-oxo-dGTP pyrophosphatase MutT (NUDIX family)
MASSEPAAAADQRLASPKPVEPKPAASVVPVRPGSGEPIEVYLIRRNTRMRFLGGYYAFPGGKVDAADSAPDALARCRGAIGEAGETGPSTWDGLPAMAFWVAAIRELFEETGVLMACDAAGVPVDLADTGRAEQVVRWRKALIANEAALTALLAGAGWLYDLRPLRYLSHFITPAASPIRFSARFFLAPLLPGQVPRLFPEEISEGFWIGARTGYRRYQTGGMRMAEPAEYGLGYLAQFDDWPALWRAHADGRHKFHGTLDRIEFYGEGYDWATATWKTSKPSWKP